MSLQQHKDVVALTSREYQPYAELNQLLGAFLKAAVKYGKATQAKIKVQAGVAPKAKDFEVFVDNFEEKPLEDNYRETSPHVEAAVIGQTTYAQSKNLWREATSSQTVATPIVYNKKQIGEIICDLSTAEEDKAFQSFQNHLARECAFFIKRYQVSQLANMAFGQPMLLVGSGKRIRRVDRFVERASEVDLPVIISGPFGTEKSHVVCAIHYSSPRKKLPLIEVDCRTLTTETIGEIMTQSVKRAAGGTLFLNGVDETPAHLQNALPRFLDSRVGQWLGSLGRSARPRPRIVASTSAPITELARQKRFSRSLVAELDFLKIHLPPLRERRSDIPALVAYTLRKYRQNEEIHLEPEAMACLQAYDWPENLFEMERVLARLTILANGEVITKEDLQTYAPTLVQELLDANEEPVVEAEILETKTLPVQEPEASPIELLAHHLLSRNYAALPNCHLGLKRALRYLAKHFCDDMSLGELAEQAFMSASHLSHLFKAELGESFKTVLTTIRIEKARQILVEDSDMRITDVAFEVGFGDLSHFTKTFKKNTGYNPKDYRLRHCKHV